MSGILYHYVDFQISRNKMVYHVMIVKNGFTYQFMFKYDGVLYGIALTSRGILI